MKNKLMRYGIDLLLIIAFLITAIVIIAPLPAEISFNKAQKLAMALHINEAVSGFENALMIWPFDSRYYGNFADFLSHNSVVQKGNAKKEQLEIAGRLYEKALTLNPVCPEYALGLGQVELTMFLEGWGKENRISAFENFKRAFENDQNGFNISYSIGYSGIVAWEYLNDGEKKFIFDRIQHGILTRPEFRKDIYPKLWQKTRDPLLFEKLVTEKEKKARLKLIENIKREASGRASVSGEILPEGWKGIADDRINRYINGSMYWSGTMDAAILIPKGEVRLKIQGRGTPADGVYPYMIVKIDDKIVGGAFVSSSEWKDYEFRINSDGQVSVLSIVFLNDDIDEKKHEDRNFFIGLVEAKSI